MNIIPLCNIFKRRFESPIAKFVANLFKSGLLKGLDDFERGSEMGRDNVAIRKLTSY